MPSDLLPHQLESIVQVFTLGGLVVTLPKATKVLFEAPEGERPWVEWESARRLKIDSEVPKVAQVSRRKRVPKP